MAHFYSVLLTDLEWVLSRFGMPTEMIEDPREDEEKESVNSIRVTRGFVARGFNEEDGEA